MRSMTGRLQFPDRPDESPVLMCGNSGTLKYNDYGLGRWYV